MDLRSGVRRKVVAGDKIFAPRRGINRTRRPMCFLLATALLCGVASAGESANFTDRESANFTDRTPQPTSTENRSLSVAPSTINGSDVRYDPTSDHFVVNLSSSDIVLSILLAVLCTSTVVGNTLVIFSVVLFRKLHTIPNMFVASLASADLVMGTLVLPFGSHAVVAKGWLLGTVACDLWTSIDVLSVTASICTLCVISLDRFFAITMPFKYSRRMTKRRARYCIAFIWLVSAVVAFVPIQLGVWKTTDPADRACYDDPHCCEFRANAVYAVVSSLVSFYIPLFIMIFAYSIVFKVALKKREKIHNNEGVFRRASMPGTRVLLWGKREYRAVFTMGIIMGTFVVCWLPFFICNVLQVFCNRCIPNVAFSIFNWLGYLNSSLNPLIYCHSKEFRRAFKRIFKGGLCREGYQQTSRASLSISYTPSASTRSSRTADSFIQFAQMFHPRRLSSNRRTSTASGKLHVPTTSSTWAHCSAESSPVAGGKIDRRVSFAVYGGRYCRDHGVADDCGDRRHDDDDDAVRASDSSGGSTCVDVVSGESPTRSTSQRRENGGVVALLSNRDELMEAARTDGGGVATKIVTTSMADIEEEEEESEVETSLLR